MTAQILVVVDDIIFLSKVQQTARQTGIEVEAVEGSKVVERAALASVRSVILDLNHRSGASIDVIRGIKSNPASRHVQVIGFLSHVQADLAVAARAAGCDLVLARSAFTQQLPQLLVKLSA